MQNDSKTALTPKLRFPEFQGSPCWDEIPMGEIYKFKNNNSLSRDKLNYESGTIKNIHYGDIHKKFSARFDITKEDVPYINPKVPWDDFRADDCAEGDMVFADASEDLKDIGKGIELVNLAGERLVAGLHTILARPSPNRLVVGFGAYLFQSRRVRVQIQKESQGAKVLGISAGRLSRIQLPLPPSKAEQQKIAECLSTLDELIEAESRKLDALKDHKTGLMQQLFPREGETRPRLRFPEFRSSGDWKPGKLGNEIQLISGTHLKPDQYGIVGEVPYFSGPSDFTNDVGGVTKWTNRSTSMAFPNNILITVKGSGVGELWFSTLPAVALGRQLMAIRSKGASIQFIYQLLLTKKAQFQRLGAGNLIPGLSRSDILEMQVYFPKKSEQKRIASCLSSLDEVIEEQGKKLEALRAHKRGLMQQLFPNPCEFEHERNFVSEPDRVGATPPR